MENDTRRHDLVKLAVQMFTTIDDRIRLFGIKEASLTESGCNKRNEFSVTAHALDAWLNAVLTSQETGI